MVSSTAQKCIADIEEGMISLYHYKVVLQTFEESMSIIYGTENKTNNELS